MGMDSTKYGGIERYNIELANQLRENGYHSVFVYESYPQVPQYAEDLCATGAELLVINSRKNICKFCKVCNTMISFTKPYFHFFTSFNI